MFGFPGNTNNAKLINFCTLYAKYFIYNHTMKGNNNNFEFLGYMIYIKISLYLKKGSVSQNTKKNLLHTLI